MAEDQPTEVRGPVCLHCLREGPPDARFCAWCGRSLVAGAEPPTERTRLVTVAIVLLLVVPIAVFALVVWQWPRGEQGQASEAALKAALDELRESVRLFHAHTGAYPARLADVVAPREDPPEKGLAYSGEPLALESGRYQGPYLITGEAGLPRNPVTGGNVEGRDWLYAREPPGTGEVRAAPGRALDGSNYSDW